LEKPHKNVIVSCSYLSLRLIDPVNEQIIG